MNNLIWAIIGMFVLVFLLKGTPDNFDKLGSIINHHYITTQGEKK